MLDGGPVLCTCWVKIIIENSRHKPYEYALNLLCCVVSAYICFGISSICFRSTHIPHTSWLIMKMQLKVISCSDSWRHSTSRDTVWDFWVKMQLPSKQLPNVIASESDLGDCFTTCLQLTFNYFLLKEPKLVQFMIVTEQHVTWWGIAPEVICQS